MPTTYTFDTNIEGWRLWNADTQSFFNPGGVRFSQSGFGGGALQYGDTDQTNAFIATPEALSGDLRYLTGGNVAFRFRNQDIQPFVADAPIFSVEVVLVSNSGTTLTASVPISPTTGVVDFQANVALTAANFGVSQAAFDAVMGDLNFFGIDGNSRALNENTTLDNVTFTPSTSANGVVDGTAADDVMGSGFTDAGGDQITNGSDTIRGYGGNDSIDGRFGNDRIEGGDGNDTLVGFDGDDTLIGGDGDDVLDASFGSNSGYEGGRDIVDGGAGNDLMIGGFGNNEVYDGGTGNDTLSFQPRGTGTPIDADLQANTYNILNDSASGTVTNTENLIGSFGNDNLRGDGGDNSLIGGNPIENGNDTLEGRGGNDTLIGMGGQDSLFGGDDDDFVDGGLGRDRMDGGSGNDSVTYANSFNSPSEAVVLDLQSGSAQLLGDVFGFETVTNFENAIGSAGSDDIGGTNGDNVIEGGGGNDTIDGRDGNDNIDGGSGDDVLIGGAGNDTIDAGPGDAVIDGGADADLMLAYSDQGSTTITGGEAGTDNDTLDFEDLPGTNGANVTLTGFEQGSGTVGTASVQFTEIEVIDLTNSDDTVTADKDADVRIEGDAGFDTVTVNGNVLSSEVQNLDTAIGTFTPTYTNGGPATINFGGVGQPTLQQILDGTFTPPGASGPIPPFGSVQITDGDRDGQIGTLDLDGIEEINFSMVCFASGTQIATVEGPKAVEELAIGDQVMTRDNGLQPIRWIGSRRFTADQLALRPNLKPIRIAQGALGGGLPERDLLVSPQHRVLLCSKVARRMFGTPEVLVPAKKLLCVDGVDVVEDAIGVTYTHFLCDRHELVWSDGAVTETLHTGAEAMKTLSEEAKAEIFEIFPELADPAVAGSRHLARLVPKGREMRKMLERIQKNGRTLLEDAA